MNATSHGPEPRDELLGVARALYAALGDARSYVYAASVATLPESDELLTPEADALLDRVDGAIADAGEYLEGVSS